MRTGIVSAQQPTKDKYNFLPNAIRREPAKFSSKSLLEATELKISDKYWEGLGNARDKVMPHTGFQRTMVKIGEVAPKFVSRNYRERVTHDSLDLNSKITNYLLVARRAFGIDRPICVQVDGTSSYSGGAMGVYGGSNTPAVRMDSGTDNDAIKVVVDSKSQRVTLTGSYIHSDTSEKTYLASELKSALEFVGTQLRHESIANKINVCLANMAGIFNDKGHKITPKYSIVVGNVKIPCKSYPQVAIKFDTRNGEMAVGRQAILDAPVEGIRKFGPEKTFDALMHSFQILDGIDSPNCCAYTL